MTPLSAPQDDPLPAVKRWLDDAAAGNPRNPWAMALATSAPTGRPSSRFVLLRGLDMARGFAVFYTNYGSRKALELERVPHAAAALYWPEAGRQLRLEGIVTRSPQQESDAYFAARPRGSQLNAWASRQSQPLPASGLDPIVAALAARYPQGHAVPRPAHWGGYRIWLEAVEFWVEGAARFHERLRYERRLHNAGVAQYEGEEWRHFRLQP